MADRDPIQPIHEPTLALVDEESAWVDAAASRFEDAHAHDLLAWAIETFHPRLAISAAGGVDGMAIIDMAWRIDPSIRVFTLDTGRLPPQGGVVGYYEPRMIDLQKKYARELLTRTNPYTKTRYVEEPAVAVIELTNENTLIGHAWGDTFDKLPARYRDELARQWNVWLKARYATTADLAAMNRISEESSGGDPRVNEVYTDRLLYQRNERMAERIEARLAEGGAFFAIGALHLYGSRGVPAPSSRSRRQHPHQ